MSTTFNIPALAAPQSPPPYELAVPFADMSEADLAGARQALDAAPAHLRRRAERANERLQHAGFNDEQSLWELDKAMRDAAAVQCCREQAQRPDPACCSPSGSSGSPGGAASSDGGAGAGDGDGGDDDGDGDGNKRRTKRQRLPPTVRLSYRQVSPEAEKTAWKELVRILADAVREQKPN